MKSRCFASAIYKKVMDYLDDSSTKTCSTFLYKCNEFGREFITFKYGSTAEIIYPLATTQEKCEGQYKIQGLSDNIKSINVRCTCKFSKDELI